jgi:hypothetical protein
MAISSSFKAKCPSCAGLILIKDPKLIGKKVECPKCKARFVVEDPAAQDRDTVAATGKNGGPADAAEQTPRPPAKKDAVTAAPPRAAAKPPAKAAPPEDDDDVEEAEDAEEVDEAPKAKTNGKAANGKSSSQIKATNGKAAAKSAPADAKDEKTKAKGKAAGKHAKDEEDEGEEEKPKGKKKKKGSKGSPKLLIGVGLAVMGVAGLVVAFLMMGKKGDTNKGGGGGQQAARGNQGGGGQPGVGAEGGNANINNGQGEQNTGQTDVTPEGGKKDEGKPKVTPPDKGGKPEVKEQRPARGGGAPAGVELTNLLPKSTQGVFQLNFKEFLDSPMAAAAFEKGGPFDNEDLRRKLGFWVTSLDRMIVAENYADGWALTVLHTLEPINDLGPLKRALGLEQPKERAIKNQDYYLITRNSHWMANLGRLSLGAPAHIRNAQPKAPNPPAPLYFRLHNRQTMIVAHLQPMRDFLTHEGRFEHQVSPTPSAPKNPSGQFPPGMPQPPAGVTPLTPGGPPGLQPLTPGGPPGQAQPGQVPQGQKPPAQGGYNPYGKGPGQSPPGQDPTGQNSPQQGPGKKRPMSAGLGPPGQTPPGQTPPGQNPEGNAQPGHQAAPAATDAYVTISPALKAMLDKMGKHAAEDERVIFVSATDMSAARLASRGDDPQRVLWRVRPVWDITHLLNERKERISVLGTGLLMKDEKNYTYKNALHCPNEKDATALRLELNKQIAPDLARVLRLILNGHKIEVVKGEEPPPAPATNPQGPPGFGPPGMGPGRFPPGMGPGRFPPGMGPGRFPPGMGPPGVSPPGVNPPGQVGPDGVKEEEKKDEPKGSRILVTKEGDDVLFRLELVLDEPAQQAMTGAMQLVLTGLRGEIDVADGAARRHDLALAGKLLGERGLTDRAILPGHYPPGAFPRPAILKRSAREPGQRVSWMAGLLPHMGHGELYRRIAFNRSWKDPVNWLQARTLVPEFIDPTFPRRTRHTPYPGLPLEAAATHYVGLAGIGVDAAEYAASDPAVVNKLGVFGYDRAASLKEISEGRGLANTILMIRTPYNGPAGVTPWMAGGGSTVRSVPEKDSAEPFFSTEPDGTRGTYALMTDGSVRFIKKGISDEAFKAMVTVRGPAPRDFDIDQEAPLVEAPKKADESQGKEQDIKPPPPKQPPSGEKGPAGGGKLVGWKEYSPPGGRCTVEFPAGEVKNQSQQVPLPGEQRATMQMYGIDRGLQGALMLMYADFPPALVPKGQEALFLDGVSKGITMKVPGAKVSGQKDIQLDGHKGRELKVDVPGQGALKVRTYLVGVRIYVLLAGGPGDVTSGAEANRFLNSLKLKAGGPAAPPNPGGGQPNPGKGPAPGGGDNGQLVGWKEFTAADQGFSVQLPGSPSKQTVEVPTPQGKIKSHLFMLELKGAAKCLLTSSPIPAAPKGGGVAGPKEEHNFFEGFKSTGLKHGKLVGEKQIRVAGYPAREFDLQTPDGNTAKTILILVSNRGTNHAYSINFLGANLIAPGDIRRIVDSFKITANPGG